MRAVVVWRVFGTVVIYGHNTVTVSHPLWGTPQMDPPLMDPLMVVAWCVVVAITSTITVMGQTSIHGDYRDGHATAHHHYSSP